MYLAVVAGVFFSGKLKNTVLALYQDLRTLDIVVISYLVPITKFNFTCRTFVMR